MTQIHVACAVGMRNAILRNHLKTSWRILKPHEDGVTELLKPSNIFSHTMIYLIEFPSMINISLIIILSLFTLFQRRV